MMGRINGKSRKIQINFPKVQGMQRMLLRKSLGLNKLEVIGMESTLRNAKLNRQDYYRTEYTPRIHSTKKVVHFVNKIRGLEKLDSLQ